MPVYSWQRGADGALLDETAHILHVCYGLSREAVARRWQVLSPDLLRSLLEDGRPVATLAMLPMGHWFGGRCVPAGGVNAVGVPPEARSGGRARRLMEMALRELQEEGIPLSSLYPANDTLYRRCDYERAGGHWEIQLPLADLRVDAGPCTVRSVREDVRAGLEEVQERFAQRHEGHARRADYNWARALRPPGPACDAYLVESEDGPEGYAVLAVERGPDQRIPVIVTDWAALTGRAGRRILALLASHAGLGTHARWYGSPEDPLVMGLDEQRFQLRATYQWMIRVVDVKGALEARGWPDQVEGRLELEFRDSLLAANDGRFVLEVEGGHGRVRPGGEGRMQLPVRALAPLYTGWMSPLRLRELGWMEADDASVGTAARLFAGERPWMVDKY